MSLEELFHSMPYEIKEKILWFTYKTQPKNLMAEIREFTQAKEYLQEFTIIIDNCNHNDSDNDEFIETTDNIYDNLWGGLYFIKNTFYKNMLIKDWKYKEIFTHTETAHKNEHKMFRLLNWEQSFSVYFWMCIYH